MSRFNPAHSWRHTHTKIKEIATTLPFRLIHSYIFRWEMFIITIIQILFTKKTGFKDVFTFFNIFFL